MITSLYHAEVIGGPSGISFALGQVTVFAPADDEHIYVIEPSALLVSGPVETGMAGWIISTVISPRLAQVSRKEVCQ